MSTSEHDNTAEPLPPVEPDQDDVPTDPEVVDDPEVPTDDAGDPMDPPSEHVLD